MRPARDAAERTAVLWCTVHAELAVNDDDIEYAAAPTAREHETRRRRSPMSGLVTQDFNLSLYVASRVCNIDCQYLSKLCR